MKNGQAPTLKDAQCIALEIKETWTGVEVQKALLVAFGKAGFPTAILKDGGCDLAKAVDLLKETNPAIQVIQDIGHIIANALKAKYSEKILFKNLLNIANSGRKRLFLTALTTLRPPKIRTKGRFQNISKLLAWALEMQKLLAGAGRPVEGSLRSKLGSALKGLSQLKPFVEKFAAECFVLNEIQQILKSQGINQNTYQAVKDKLKSLSPSCPIRKTIQDWLQQTQRVQCLLSMGQTPLIVSSDIIECLIGQLKHILERNPIPEFTTMTLAVPLLCGQLSKDTVTLALESCSHKTLTSWRMQNCAHSERHVRQQLVEHIKQNQVPKTGPRKVA
jgi:hypothetical protein